MSRNNYIDKYADDYGKPDSKSNTYQDAVDKRKAELEDLKKKNRTRYDQLVSNPNRTTEVLEKIRKLDFEYEQLNWQSIQLNGKKKN